MYGRGTLRRFQNEMRSCGKKTGFNGGEPLCNRQRGDLWRDVGKRRGKCWSEVINEQEPIRPRIREGEGGGKTWGGIACKVNSTQNENSG